jgi:hypothetical protein
MSIRDRIEGPSPAHNKIERAIVVPYFGTPFAPGLSENEWKGKTLSKVND